MHSYDTPLEAHFDKKVEKVYVSSYEEQFLMLATKNKHKGMDRHWSQTKVSSVHELKEDHFKRGVSTNCQEM